MGKPTKRRNKSSGHEETGDNQTPTTTSTDNNTTENGKDGNGDDDAGPPTSAWKTIYSHPTFLAIVFLVIPWLLSKQVSKVYFQYPHHVNHFLDVLEDKGIYQTKSRLRPAMAMTDKRQLLVVGSMSSGTSQVAHDLMEKLGLEVGHEDSDTSQYPVRDGTVSWFHGLRYLNRPVAAERARITVEFCKVAWRIYSSDKINPFHPWSNYGTELILWGPTSYSLPVFHPSFRTSYLQTCQETIFREMGCGMNDNCKMAPFQRTLLQTREPWRIVTSLITKYCDGGKSEAPKSLLLLFHAIYPDYASTWFPPQSDASSDDHKLKVCSEQMASYVHLWYNDLMDSFETLHQQDPDNFLTYHIEDTSICQVAAMAGFDVQSGEFRNDKGNDAVVYAPNVESVNEFCTEHYDMGFGNTQNQFNSRNMVEGSSETSKDGNAVENPAKQEQKLNAETVQKVLSKKTAKKIDELSTRMGYQ